MRPFGKQFLVLVCLALLSLTGCVTGNSASVKKSPMNDGDIIKQMSGTVWVAEYIHGQPVADMTHTSMVFTLDGGVNGGGGCNAYTGRYAIKDGIITFPPMASTRKLCPPAISDQERRFFRSLAKPQKVSFENGLLHFTPDGGEPSVFAPQNME